MNVYSLSEYEIDVALVGDAIVAMPIGGCRITIQDGKIRYEGWMPYLGTLEDDTAFLQIFTWAGLVREAMKLGRTELIRGGTYDPRKDFAEESKKIIAAIGPRVLAQNLLDQSEGAETAHKSRSGRKKK